MQGANLPVPADNLGEALRASLAGALATFLAALPRILGFLVVLIVGWIISSLLARGVAALLGAIRFNDLARRSGLDDFVRNMGIRAGPADVIGNVVKWFVRLMVLVVAFDLLGLPAVSVVLQQLLLWLPNLVVALVVLVVGGLAANAVSRLARGATAEAGFSNPDVLATVAKVAVWSFTIVVAINQLGIATELINTLLVGVVGALALAAGLAFGLGGRDRAAEILDGLGRAGGRPNPQLELTQEFATDPGRGGTAREVHPSRSGIDRRRVSRPGPDRRIAG